MSKNLQSKIKIETIIKQAVSAGIAAGRTQAERAATDAYKATERRLYALPVLIKKVKDANEQMEEIKQNGVPSKSKDIIRFTRSGVRLSSEEIINALIINLEASIAADEYEIETVKKALKNIQDDPHYLTVEGRYFEGMSDVDIAKDLSCDERTVRRHRGRLVRIVAIWLYGAEAV